MRTQLFTLFFGLFISLSIIQAQSMEEAWTKDYFGNLIGYANFDNDSNIELLFFDNLSGNWNDRFVIVDGVTGQKQFGSGAGSVYDIMSVTPVDVNNDGRSEILMTFNSQNSSTKQMRLYAFGSLGINEKGEEENGFYSSNYPNPFFNSTTIEYKIESGVANVSIHIYDQSGNLIFTTEEGKKESGNHQFRWNGMDTNGTTVNSGTYFYSIQIDGIQGTRTMIKL